MLKLFKICGRWWREIQYNMVNRLRTTYVKPCWKKLKRISSFMVIGVEAGDRR